MNKTEYQGHTYLTVDASTPKLRRDSQRNANQYIKDLFIPVLETTYYKYNLNPSPLTIRNYTDNCDE